MNRNRFIVSFLRYRVEMIFSYPLSMEQTEREENVAAMREHLIYIDGLEREDWVKAREGLPRPYGDRPRDSDVLDRRICRA